MTEIEIKYPCDHKTGELRLMKIETPFLTYWHTCMSGGSTILYLFWEAYRHQCLEPTTASSGTLVSRRTNYWVTQCPTKDTFATHNRKETFQHTFFFNTCITINTLCKFLQIDAKKCNFFDDEFKLTFLYICTAWLLFVSNMFYHI